MKGPDMLDRGVLANRHGIGLFEESLTCRVHFNTYIASEITLLTLIARNVDPGNLRLTNLHLFFSTLKNYIITTTHLKNTNLAWNSFCFPKVFMA